MSPGAPGDRSGRLTTRVPASLARAAALIAVLTVLARLSGLGRMLVFARTVGQNCLGDTYQAVNTVPNIVFEVVAGGALASLVVPLLAGPVERGDREHVRQTSSALLCWTLIVLVPLAVLIVALAGPIAGLLLADKPGCGAAAVRVGTGMLRVFAPQIPLYGIGIVLTGILQAHRRFAGPALAPLLSSLAVVGAYLAYGALAAPSTAVADVGAGEKLVLSLGTTAGVVVLTLCLLIPVHRSAGVRLCATLRFPDGVVGHAARLAGAGAVTLGAQQVAVLVALRLGNASGVPAGYFTDFTYAQTIFLLPWAVLAVPVATSVFPRLAGRHSAADEPGYARTLATAVRLVLLLSLFGAAALIALAGPVARVVVQNAPGTRSTEQLAQGIAGFAPGLVGLGLFALLSRALYARRRSRTVAFAAVGGWVAVVLADVALSTALPADRRVLALGLGNSIGMTVLGGGLLIAVRRTAGAASLAGAARTSGAGLAAAVLGAAVAAPAWTGGGVLAALGQAMVHGAIVLLIFAAVLALLARGDLRLLGRRSHVPAGST